MMKNAYIYCLDLTNGDEGGGSRHARAVERQRRPARAASTVAEETGGVESDMDLESFTMKSEMSRGGLLFIDSKLLAAVLN
jgi:hypothetical protein